MATNRYTLAKYATLELNHISFSDTARVFAQLPLDTSDFTDAAPAEMGMWLVYDMLGGSVRKPDAVTESVGIIYNNEKEYSAEHKGLNEYALKPGEVYPRMGLFMVGDTYTTNCFCYDTGEFVNDAAVNTALAAIAAATPATHCYLVTATNGAPRLTKDATVLAAAGTAAKVVKVYTMPNGELGLKVQFVKVA